MKTGIASVTLRDHSVGQIAALAKRAQLDGIEWGGDVHVPPGDAAAARLAKTLCRKQGLAILSYGSYYRAEDGDSFAPVLETALRLEAPVIRVWAGRSGPQRISEQLRRRVADRLEQAALAAAGEGMVVAAEYHRNTLTETLESAAQLLAECPHLRTYWQPNPDIPQCEQLRELRALREKIIRLHAFAWSAGNERHPFSHGLAGWREYISALNGAGEDIAVLLEFVLGDTPRQVLEDAEQLKILVSGA